MDLASITAAPLPIPLGSRYFRISPVTLGDIGELLALASIHLEPAEDREKLPPLFSHADTQEFFLGPIGKPSLVFLATRRHQPSITYDEARLLSLEMGPEDDLALMSAYFRRRPTLVVDANGDGTDISDTEWGPLFNGLADRFHVDYEAIGRMTLDQIANACEPDGVSEAGGKLIDPRDVQAMWEKATKEDTIGAGTIDLPVTAADAEIRRAIQEFETLGDPAKHRVPEPQQFIPEPHSPPASETPSHDEAASGN